MQPLPYIREACVESISQAMAAQQQGADRVEYCGDLSVGGITPPLDELQMALRALSIPMRVMLRPRGGHFYYSAQERSLILAQAQNLHQLGVTHIVTGSLNAQGTLDLSLLEELLVINPQWSITVHKVIDESANPLADVKQLAQLPANISILSSGAAPTAFEGLPLLRQLLQATGDDIELVACGKVTQQNLPQLHAQLLAKAYHGRLIVGTLS